MRKPGFLEAFRILSARPECEHGLNGPCAVCGPGATLEEARILSGEALASQERIEALRQKYGHRRRTPEWA